MEQKLNQSAKRIINLLLNGSLLVSNEEYQKQMDKNDTAIKLLKFFLEQGKIAVDELIMAFDFLNINGQEREELGDLLNYRRIKK